MEQPTIGIHIITYNEEIMLPVTIKHYKKMFGDNCFFFIHDNISTDNTIEIAKSLGCTVVSFETNGLSDSAYVKIKSEVHLNTKYDWCLCVDCDEHCYITTDDLIELENKEVNIVEFEGWDIFANADNPEDIKEFIGFKTGGYNKPALLKTGEFKEFKVVAGAHGIASLIPNEGKQILWSKQEFKLIHMKHWNLEFIIQRQREFGKRLSIENQRMGWGIQYTFSPEIHTEYFNNGLKTGQIITDKRFDHA